MVDRAVLLAAPSDGAQVGKVAVGHSAELPLIALAKDLPMRLVYPGGPCWQCLCRLYCPSLCLSGF